ncbi:TetR/AcrR family transcriptional regulator [Couchioplanes caeruleus]|uniref:TetR/AcrR family transcriptional regulator n=1 Tax=Couchioplanes caeruleus TaxID=56438 RepID=UPI0020BF5B58|nr:TetR/AcrR family transcriptional regulator [Couchioplanes caeruleus]UQU64453.1 TetR/AcrR family transcriptional regulator [Couchioplanes caeruleus]
MSAASPATTARKPSARDRLLAAADELFYAEGVHTVGIDRVIERAGVAKASLYSSFGSKDGLIRAYLEGRHLRRRERLLAALERYDSPRDKLLGVFDVLAEMAAQSSFRGCAFYNASAESPRGGVVEEVCDTNRAWTRRLFTDLAREAGVADPEALAAQLVLLYDGSTVGARMDRDVSAPSTARAVAAALLDAATAR